MEREWSIDCFLKTPPEGGLDYVVGREPCKNLFQCCFSGEQLEEWLCLPKAWNFLFCGERGIGKSFLARAFAAELGKKGYQYLELSGHELAGKNEEEAEIRVRCLAEKLLSGEKVFFLLKNAEETGRAASDLADVLEEGREEDFPVITVALAEDFERIPGVLIRLFRIIRLEKPNEQERKAYFRMFWENSFLKSPAKLTVDKMAEITEGLSFSQLDDVRMYMNGGMCRWGIPKYSSVEVFCTAVEEGKMVLSEKSFRDMTEIVRKSSIIKTEESPQTNTQETGTLEVLTEVLKTLTSSNNIIEKQTDLVNVIKEEDEKSIPIEQMLSEMNSDKLDWGV